MINKLIISALLAGCAQAPATGPVAPVPAFPGIVYTSADEGLTWQSAGSGLSANAQVEYIETQGEYVFAGTENRGLYRKRKNGGDWEQTGRMQFAFDEKITGLYAAGQDLFACVYRGGLYKSSDSGNTWVSMHNALKDKAVRAIYQKEKTLLVGVDSGVFVTDDGGKTWEQVFDEGQVNTLTEVNGILLAGTYKGLIRSNDGGKHWKWVLQEGAVFKTPVINNRIFALNSSDGFMVSDDTGLSWEKIETDLPPGKDVFDMVQLGDYYLCGHSNGIYRSAKDGAHWEQVREATGETFLDLKVVNGMIYGGTVHSK